MKLDDIHSEWAKDAPVDETEIDKEARAIPLLHAKYLKYMSDERMIQKKLQHEFDELENAKIDRLIGKMSEEELRERGWEPERRKYLRSDLGNALKADKDLIELKLRIALQQEKVDVLDNIVRAINNRNFILKSMIDWIKFKTGNG